MEEDKRDQKKERERKRCGSRTRHNRFSRTRRRKNRTPAIVTRRNISTNNLITMGVNTRHRVTASMFAMEIRTMFSKESMKTTADCVITSENGGSAGCGWDLTHVIHAFIEAGILGVYSGTVSHDFPAVVPVVGGGDGGFVGVLIEVGNVLDDLGCAGFEGEHTAGDSCDDWGIADTVGVGEGGELVAIEDGVVGLGGEDGGVFGVVDDGSVDDVGWTEPDVASVEGGDDEGEVFDDVIDSIVVSSCGLMDGGGIGREEDGGGDGD